MTTFWHIFGVLTLVLAGCNATAEPAEDTKAGIDSSTGDSSLGDPDVPAGDEHSGPTDCQTLSLAFSQAVQDVQQGKGTCQTDDDCLLILPSLSCPSGAQVGMCQVAVAVTEEDAFQTELDSVTATLCQDVTSPCVAMPSCAGVDPTCVSGQCQTVVTTP